MDHKQIPVTDVKKYFLLADAGKGLFKNKPTSAEELKEGYEKLKEQIFNLTKGKVDEKIKDKVRLKRYNKFDWYSGDIDLAEIGPYPKMNSLEIGLTTGNIIDTANSIKHTDSKDEPLTKFRTKSESMIKNSNFIYENFPLILFQGGVIRGDYNTWAKENNKPLCEIFSYDVDDGNCRAVSYSLANMTKAPCFYGR